MRIFSSKKIKIIISFLLLSLSLCRGFMVYVSASESKNYSSDSYIFEINNMVIEYYLDGNNMPYVLQNGKQMPIALPLDHLRVTDEEILAELNVQKTYREINNRSFNPVTYFDMTNGGTYTDTFYLTDSYQDTLPIRVNLNHHVIRIRTSNEIKNNIFTGKKISFMIYYYFEPLDYWYNQTFNDINVSNEIGCGVDLLGLYPYVYYKIKKSSNLSQVDVHIWQSDI